MQKIFHALFFAIVLFNGSAYGMEAKDAQLNHTKLSEQVTVSSRQMIISMLNHAHLGECAEVSSLLNEGVNIEAQSTDGITALGYASIKGHAEVIKLLLDAGANVNNLDKLKRTPLYYAVYNNNIEVVKLLLDAGAYITWNKYDTGYFRGKRVYLTPLWVAMKMEHTKMVKFLEERLQHDAWEKKNS